MDIILLINNKKICDAHVHKTSMKSIVVFQHQKESRGKCLLCISIKQRIDNMYTQVAIHTFILSSSFSLLLDKLQFL